MLPTVTTHSSMRRIWHGVLSPLFGSESRHGRKVVTWLLSSCHIEQFDRDRWRPMNWDVLAEQREIKSSRVGSSVGAASE